MLTVKLKYDQAVNIDVNAAMQNRAFIEWALAFAIRQSAGDADAGKAGTDDGKTAVMEKAERLAAFEVPTGGAGGARLTPYQRALRDVVEALLREWGAKAVDARKAAQEPESGFMAGIRGRLAQKAGTPEAAVDEADVKAAFDANWPTITAKAKKIAETAAAPAIDL